MTISNFYESGPKNSDDVQSLVVMLHGVGSNGQDLISLAPMLSAYVPGTMFISPDAPFVCDMVPPGYPNAYQWFSLQNRDPHVMLEGVKSVSSLVEEFLESQLERYKLSADKLALLGFSQGTMTSLYVAPRLNNKIAGVLGYSGALLWDEATDANAMHKMPINLIHGEADDVVPVEAYHTGRAKLEEVGFDVSGHTTPHLPHSLDQQGIDAGGAFLKKILS
ncbi:MAG: alpha/beta hydrolase [Alphaproteobacteria bacterium]